MKLKTQKILKAVILTVIGLLPETGKAEVVLDKNYAWDVGVDFMSRQGVKPLLSATKKSIETSIGYKPVYNGDERATARMIWNGEVFYVSAVQYQNREQLAVTRRYKEVHPVKGGGVCTFYVTDANLHVVAHLDLKFPEHQGNTWCNGVYGVGKVKGQDALLVPVSYYLTDDVVLANSVEKIGSDWRWMTVMLRLKQQNGQVMITQDDRCLGNPNPYRDIPTARKAMKQRPWCTTP